MEFVRKPPTEKAPPDRFIGDAWLDVIVRGEEPSRVRVSVVRFAPGTRNAWHAHAVGQTVHVTDGVGRMQARGGELLEIRAGETVYTPPGEWHWHGAAPDHFMTHLAIWEAAPEGPESEWGDQVADADYLARPRNGPADANVANMTPADHTVRDDGSTQQEVRMAMDELEVAGQPVRAYVADTAGADAPGVIVFHAWWGLNDDVTAFADRLADAGFFVIAPDLYGGAVTAEVDEAKRLTGTVDEEHANAIALAAVERLASRPGARTIGAVGFSFGAHWAVWSPTQRPDGRGPSVVYYGTTGGPVLAQQGGPVLGHFAEDDPFEGPEDIAAFEEGLRAGGRQTTIHLYPDTGHWFAEPSRDAYRQDAADLAFERTVEFLRGV